MICEQCATVGKKVDGCFTNQEKIQALTGQAAFMRTILSAKDDHVRKQSLIVANSIITKFLMSYDVASRETLCQYIRQSAEIDFKLEHCAHSSGLVLLK